MVWTTAEEASWAEPSREVPSSSRSAHTPAIVDLNLRLEAEPEAEGVEEKDDELAKEARGRGRADGVVIDQDSPKL